jgi:hypothetical protein
VIAVTGSACTAATVLDLVAAGAVVIVWSPDADLCGRLVATVEEAGGWAASFVAADTPGAAEVLRSFATEQFGGLDGVMDGA